MPGIGVRVLVLAVLCAAPSFGRAAADASPPVVLAGVTGGVCAAQLQKCTGRCRGSGVCTSRCLANDRACRVGGKPIYR
ncbi:MAG TPA: hypothetical protein VEK73_11480 [Xanthobacteraceae bacterium]|nr:hypothetical protein [Xanthobacteraceae bacterium]